MFDYWYNYWWAGAIIVAIVSFFSTNLMIWIAKKYNILDNPNFAPERKLQKEPIPLLGGTGFVLVAMFFTGTLWLIKKFDIFNSWQFLETGLYVDFHLFWIFLAMATMLFLGFLDDKYRLSFSKLALPSIVAMCIAVFLGGLKIEAFSYPFDNIVLSNYWVSSGLALIWLGFCTASTKFLDGHDGLVASVSFIAFANIATISLFSNVNQPLIFLISIIWAASCLGFLPKNLPNAQVYLGEGASQVLGFMIGVLSIISGAKVATSFSIMGWFILDVLLVFIYRMVLGQHPFKGDRKHWHFRLSDIGFSKWEFLGINWSILAISAMAAILLDTGLKAVFLIGVLIFLVLLFLLTEMYRWRQNQQKTIKDETN